MRFMCKRAFISLYAVLLLMLSISVVTAQTLNTRTYQASNVNFANPERGFFIQRTPLWRAGQRIALDPTDLAEAYAAGISLVRTYYLLERYRDRPLDTFVLEALQADMHTARSNGFKVILRFAYNFPTNADYQASLDAPLDIVLQHIAQLKPILRAHADVIAHLEAGFIGAWGEWHSSSNRLIDYPERGLNTPARAIISSLLEALPQTRMVALRYPLLKQQLFGVQPLHEEQAFSGEPQARIGAHDDCFLASATNRGTYLNAHNQPQIAHFKAYLHADNRYVVQSGETCNSDTEAQPFVSCRNALAELSYLRWSSLNLDYHPEVIQTWRREGCFEEIARRLGYRLRLIEASAPPAPSQDGTVEVWLRLNNDGFASPYNPRGFALALRSVEGKLYPLKIDQAPDPRLWLPERPIFVQVRAKLPDKLPEGSYELMLSLPAPEPSLSSDPRYSIRLANEGLWDAGTGYHALGLWLKAGASQ
ncbi:MAG: hypothetical protein CUN49_07535 [Candidatus Thermofonsia Clade 1 bacterium]|jgi:hypothetical protein|uniref:DUF4832 domain-containing protein n=1 Tax=Candidatus Thermofonsia Clade 1 bacterium TaxID=2364210 RepID=A0A2M8PET0_9CHLR|nr:MAG: hypothetical protein CUN49_07535 [Candidatus Thermofonsia Clade 1 bacterium]